VPHQLAVTAIGTDRPGIIARVTGVLHEHGGNLEDSSMTILGGHFAIMLLVSCDAAPDALEEALRTATEDLGLVVTVRPVGPGRTRRRPPTSSASTAATGPASSPRSPTSSPRRASTSPT
jgi:glycine cleavage system regulatory protein